MSQTLKITSPTTGTTIAGTVAVVVTATGVKRVNFFLDGTQVGTDTTIPFTYLLDTTKLANGSHKIRAASGSKAVSSTVTVTVANAAPTPTPSSRGSILFDGRAARLTELVSHEVQAGTVGAIGPIKWPDGSVHYFYTKQNPTVYDGCLCFIKDDLSLVPDARYGKAIKAAVKTGDTNQWHGNKGGTVNGAGEISQHRKVALETWTWHALAVRVDAWNLAPSDLRFADVLSLGYQTSSNDQVSLQLRGPNNVLSWHVVANGGYVNGPLGSANGTTRIIESILPVTFGKWEEFIVGVKWSTHTTGAIDIRHRTPSVDATWKQIFSRSGIDTELWGSITNPDGSVRNFARDASDWATIIDKFGMYFGHSSQTVTTETVYHSGYVLCPDLATAQAQFPA